MKKVLIVDDNELSIKLIKGYLSQLGCEVRVSDSPFGVLKIIKDFCPDVMLLDLNMPGLGGRSVAGLIRKNYSGGNLKMIVFSAEPESVLQQMVADGLVDDYFAKGSPFDNLRMKVLA